MYLASLWLRRAFASLPTLHDPRTNHSSSCSCGCAWKRSGSHHGRAPHRRERLCGTLCIPHSPVEGVHHFSALGTGGVASWLVAVSPALVPGPPVASVARAALTCASCIANSPSHPQTRLWCWRVNSMRATRPIPRRRRCRAISLASRRAPYTLYPVYVLDYVRPRC